MTSPLAATGLAGILLAGILLAATTGAFAGTPERTLPPPHHPHDIIAAAVLSPGYPDDPRMFVASPGTMNLFLVSRNAGRTWKGSRSGIAGKLFRQIALASDWEKSGIAYVITEDSGLQISSDFAHTWQPPALTQKWMRFLAVPPVDDDGGRFLYCATNWQVFRSTDGGKTTQPVNVPKGEAKLTALGVSGTFGRDNTVAVGTTDSKLLISDDRGQRWTKHRVTAPIQAIAFSPTYDSDGTLWVATWGKGVLCSTDRGASFGACAPGLLDQNVNDVAVVKGEAGFELFACTRDDGVYHSADGGGSWIYTSLRIEKTEQTDNHHTSLAVSPAWPRDKTVLCGTFEGLQVSLDGGMTWRERNINPTRIGRILAMSPNYAKDGTLFGAGYGMHLLASEDRGDSWELRASQMNALSVYSVVVSPDYANDKLVMMGLWHGVRRSTNSGKTWEIVDVPPHPEQKRQQGYTMRAITFSPHFTEDRKVFSISTWGVFYRSDDAGKSWTPLTQPTTWGSGVALSPRFSEDQTLYVSGGGIWRSRDGGQTFEGPLFEGHVHGNGLVLPPDFNETDEMYAIVQYDGFMIGTKEGTAWQPSNEGLQGFMPAAIKLSPRFDEDDTIYLLTNGGGLFASGDRGRRWRRITTPGSVVDQSFALAVSPDFPNDKTFFVGTFNGFYRSTDGGLSWTPTTRFEIYDDKRDPWIRRGDHWKFLWGGQPVNLSSSVSNFAGETISMDFNGTGLRVLGPKGPDHGIAEILIDGVSRSRVDCYATDKADQQVLFEAHDLPDVAHELRLRVTGDKNAEARDAWVGIDAVEIRFEPEGSR